MKITLVKNKNNGLPLPCLPADLPAVAFLAEVGALVVAGAG